jgi:hypothetical protein
MARKNYKQMAEKLAGCVTFALKFLDTRSRTAVMINLKTGKSKPWQDDFMDVLDECGIKIDRKKYWKQKYPRG